MKQLINYKLVATPLVVLLLITNAQAQFGKKIKGLGKQLEETPSTESDGSQTEAPEEATKFYSDIESTDNFREKELNKFGTLYDFQSTRSVEFEGYNNITEPERASGNMEKISKIKELFPGLSYRRSSIYTLMVHNTERPHYNVIAKSFGNSRIPDKYNDHNIGPYLLATNLKKDSVVTFIDQYIKDEAIAKKLVARWFNRSAEGGFNMDLIAERGSYNASDLDLKLAQSSQRGKAILADAGEELIQNTFTVINDYKFLSLEAATALMQELASASANTSGGIGKSLMGEAKSSAFQSAGEISSAAGELVKGYVVLSTSYLYKLEWSDSVAAVFYEQYWNEDGTIDQAKKSAFENSNIFTLKKVGFQSDFQIIPNILTDKSYPELISTATQKATDKAMAKLQRNYEEFKTKTPLYGIDPAIAKIGKKEGLKKKDKFEVLEQYLDNEGRTKYKKKGVLVVDEDNIWDNTFSDDTVEDENQATQFKGSTKGLYAGMLLRQIK